MRDTLHCVHICWLTQLNQTSHQSMVFPGANHFKINFLFSILHCSPITVSPPHFFLSPPGFGQFHGQSSVSASPFFLIGYFQTIDFALIPELSPMHFTLLSFLKLCHPAWSISIASIFISLFICSVHSQSRVMMFFCEWFMIQSVQKICSLPLDR